MLSHLCISMQSLPNYGLPVVRLKMTWASCVLQQPPGGNNLASLLIEPQGMVWWCCFFLAILKEKSRCMEERPRFSLASNYLMIKYHRNEWKNVQTSTGWRFHSPEQDCHTMAHITYLDGTSFWKCHSTWLMVCLCSLLDMDESGNMWIIQLSLQFIPQISILALTVLVMTKSSRLIFSTHITVCYMSHFRITKRILYVRVIIFLIISGP